MSQIKRRPSKKIMVGNVPMGGDSPIVLQSMTNRDIEDMEETIEQIERLKNAGADIVRLAVKNKNSISYLQKIVKKVKIPIVADIHFDYKLALAAIDAGVSKIRINPGNIGEQWKVEEVVNSASKKKIPIRIGVNGGSIDRDKYDHPTAENMVKSAIDHIKILEDLSFDNIAISIKSSNIFDTIEANKLMAESRDYPIHLGLTEAGYGLNSIVQSSITIGNILMAGIGDTIRVSMTGDPVEEIHAGRKILESLDLKYRPVKIISCPTCGRTSKELDILELAMDVEAKVLEKFQEKLESKNKQLTIAVMGCEVNGPGEAAEADFGLAGCQNGKVMIFAKGKQIITLDYKYATEELLNQIEKSIHGA